MNLRYVVPALGLIALSATAASAQEIAKGVTLDGYIDTIFTGTSNSTSVSNGNNSPSTTDFSATAVAKVGWAINDKAKAMFSLKSVNDGDGSGNVALYEAYGTVIAAPGLEISSGKSLTPFGYYSGYATGLTTITSSMTQANMYTGNAVGAWATYTKDKLVATVIVADGFTGAANNTAVSSGHAGNYGLSGATNKVSKPGTISPGLDIVFNATPEFSVNLEGYLDPSAGNAKPATGENGSVYAGGLNAQFKNEKILAAFEVIYKVTEYGGKTADDNITDLGWSATLTYTLPADVMAGAVTAEVGQYLKGENGGADTNYTVTKAQLALLTNPVAASQFGLNYELFYINDKSGDSSIKAIDAYGLAIEGLYVIP